MCAKRLSSRLGGRVTQGFPSGLIKVLSLSFLASPAKHCCQWEKQFPILPLVWCGVEQRRQNVSLSHLSSQGTGGHCTYLLTGMKPCWAWGFYLLLAMVSSLSVVAENGGRISVTQCRELLVRLFNRNKKFSLNHGGQGWLFLNLSAVERFQITSVPNLEPF